MFAHGHQSCACIAASCIRWHTYCQWDYTQACTAAARMQQCYMGTMTSPMRLLHRHNTFMSFVLKVSNTVYTWSMLLKYEISHISLDNIFVLEDQDDHQVASQSVGMILMSTGGLGLYSSKLSLCCVGVVGHLELQCVQGLLMRDASYTYSHWSYRWD